MGKWKGPYQAGADKGYNWFIFEQDSKDTVWIEQLLGDEAGASDAEDPGAYTHRTRKSRGHIGEFGEGFALDLKMGKDNKYNLGLSSKIVFLRMSLMLLYSFCLYAERQR